MPESPQGNVVPINLTVQDAKKHVQGALEPSGQLRLTTHVRSRMRERDISITQVRQILKQGVITEGPFKDTQGRWNCRFEGYAAGEGIGVAVGFQFMDGVEVVVITTFELNNYR